MLDYILYIALATLGTGTLAIIWLLWLVVRDEAAKRRRGEELSHALKMRQRWDREDEELRRMYEYAESRGNNRLPS